MRKTDSTILASVNGDPITVQDLVDQFTKRHGGHAKFLGGDMEARTFLKLLVDERLFVQEAYNVGLDQDLKLLELVKTFENERLADRLVQLEINDKAKVSPEEVKAAWKQSLNVFFHVRQIAVATKEEADEIRAAILAGADADTFARTCSLADSRLNGGHVVVNWGQFDEGWERIVFALEPGEIAPVIPTPGGFEVVIVENRVDAPLPPFDKVQQQVEQVLSMRRLETRKRAFSDELFAKYHVVLQPSPGIAATWDGGGQLLMTDVVAPGERLSARELDKRLRATANAPLVALEARSRKLEEQPDVVRAVAKYRENLMEGFLFRDHILKDVAVTDAEARAYYDAHKEQYVEAEQRHVAHILVATEGEAKALREKLTAGADFAQLARKSSRDAGTALLDGKLGWITPDKVPPAFKSVLSLKAGEVSQPLKSDHGWHLVLVTDVKPQRQMAFDEVAERVRKNARQVKEQTVQDFWLQKLRAAARIEVDDAAVKKFVAENQFDPTAAKSH